MARVGEKLQFVAMEAITTICEDVGQGEGGSDGYEESGIAACERALRDSGRDRTICVEREHTALKLRRV
jgi:hypothetical protein